MNKLKRSRKTSNDRQKILSILLIFSALLMTPMLATGQEETAADEQLILSRGDRAPFVGVLIPEYMYREMIIDVTTKEFFDRELQTCKREKADCVPRGTVSMGFISGVGAGALLALLVVVAIR